MQHKDAQVQGSHLNGSKKKALNLADNLSLMEKTFNTIKMEGTPNQQEAQ